MTNNDTLVGMYFVRPLTKEVGRIKKKIDDCYYIVDINHSKNLFTKETPAKKILLNISDLTHFLYFNTVDDLIGYIIGKEAEGDDDEN